MSSRGTYRTIHSSLLDDPDFQSLSMRAIACFFSLRLCKEHGASGLFRYYINTVAQRVSLTVPLATKAMEELAITKPGQQYGWIVYNDTICWVVNGLRYDPHVSLANPKHKSRVLTEVSELPRQQIILKYCDYYNLPYPFAWECDTHALQDKEKEKEEEKEKDKDSNTSPRQIPVEPVEWGSQFSLIQKYNRETPDNVPAVVSVSKTRLDREKAALRQYPDKSWWTTTFQQYHQSRFLSGRVALREGHSSFKPDFDWLLSKGRDGVENVIKVHDGRYRD